jgi:hypothetical protein
MPLLVAVIVSVSVALAIVLFLNIRQVFVSNCDLPLTVDWIDALSAERYLPMLRLLDGRDLELLRNPTGIYAGNGACLAPSAVPDFLWLPALPDSGLSESLYSDQAVDAAFRDGPARFG